MESSPPQSRIWLAVAPAMVIPLLASLFYFVLFSEHAFARILYGSTKLFQIVWPLLALRFILGDRFPKLRGTGPTHWRALPLGLLCGLAVAGGAFVLLETPVGSIVRGGAGPIRAKAVQMGFLEHYWSFALFLSIIHSLLEEYYWRWFVFGRLRHVLAPAAAHLLAAAAFASHHIVVTTQYFPLAWGWLFGGLVGVGGLMFSWLYARQQTLAGAWLAHLIIDLAVMAIGYRLIA